MLYLLYAVPAVYCMPYTQIPLSYGKGTPCYAVYCMLYAVYCVLDELMVYSKSLELKESKYETSWLEDTIRSIALSIWRKVDHNSEF